MIRILDVLMTDEEILQLKKAWEEQVDEFPPPYHYEQYSGLEHYKEYMRCCIDHRERLTHNKFAEIMKKS